VSAFTSVTSSPASDLASVGALASQSVASLVADATQRIREEVTDKGRISSERLEAHQHAAHGLAWLATYAEAVRELAAYAERLAGEGRFGETEELLVRIGGYRRNVILPDSMVRLKAAGAKIEGDKLRVRLSDGVSS
jgi:(2S)-methylsuccinyl-CoA dehydrogenase